MERGGFARRRERGEGEAGAGRGAGERSEGGTRRHRAERLIQRAGEPTQRTARRTRSRRDGVFNARAVPKGSHARSEPWELPSSGGGFAHGQRGEAVALARA